MLACSALKVEYRRLLAAQLAPGRGLAVEFMEFGPFAAVALVPFGLQSWGPTFARGWGMCGEPMSEIVNEGYFACHLPAMCVS